jgi:hypothetical protein
LILNYLLMMEIIWLLRGFYNKTVLKVIFRI